MSDGNRLASAGDNIKIWELPELPLVKTLSHHSQTVGSICWNHNNQCLASAAAGDNVVVTYMKGNAFTTTELATGENQTCVAFNSNSRYLLTGGKSKVLSVWDLKTKVIKKTYKEHVDDVTCLKFNYNDTSIASGSVSGDILLHNVVTGQASVPLRTPKVQAVRALQFSHFKKSLLGSVGDDGALNLWDTNARKLIHSFVSEHSAPTMGLCFSPMNDMLLTTAGYDKKIVFYDVQSKKPIKTMMAEAPLASVDFKYDGATLAVGTTRGKILMYDLRSGSSPVKVLSSAHNSSVQCLVFQSSGSKSSSGASKSSKTASQSQEGDKAAVGARNLPDHPKTGSAPEFKEPEPASRHGLLPQQNGLKQQEEDTGIFSPLREGTAAKSSEISDRLPQPNLGQESKTEGKEDIQMGPEGTGVFSPLASHTVTKDVRYNPQSSTVSSGTGLFKHFHDVPASTTPQSEQAGGAKLGPDYLASSTRPQVDSQFRTRMWSSDSTSSNDSGQLSREGSVRSTGSTDAEIGRFTRGGSGRSNDGDIGNFTRGGSGRGIDGDLGPFSQGNSGRGFEAEQGQVTGRRLDGEMTTSLQSPRRLSNDTVSALKVPSSPLQKRSQPIISGTSQPSTGAELCKEKLDVDKLSGAEMVKQLASGLGETVRLNRSNEAVSYPDFRNSATQNGQDAAMASGAESGAVAALQPFQVEFIRNMIEDSLDELRDAFHRDIVNLQVEMLRQFQIQLNEVRGQMEKFSVNEELVKEIERLSEENRRLKNKY